MGKVIPFVPRTGISPGDPSWEEISGRLQLKLAGVEVCLAREVERAPRVIKENLRERLGRGEHFCAALFLAVAGSFPAAPHTLSRVGAALEALHLALEVHGAVEAESRLDRQPAGTILEGDYLFSLALSLAAENPLFIKGMAEIIARSVSGEINLPPRRAPWMLWRRHMLACISSRSASIAALAASLGGWQAGLSPPQVEAVTYFGHYLGMARKLCREFARTRQGLESTNLQLELSLPLAYLLEISSRQAELAAMLHKGCSTAAEKEILLQEWEKVNPRAYMDALAGSCLKKAKRSLELLDESADRTLLELFLSTCVICN